MRCGGKINLGVRGQYLMEQLASLLGLALRKRGKVLGADRKASGGEGESVGGFDNERRGGYR